jgi:hypothetical protein
MFGVLALGTGLQSERSIVVSIASFLNYQVHALLLLGAFAICVVGSLLLLEI